MLEQVDSIIIRGKILYTSDIKAENRYNFNENQLKEEREKLLWTQQNPTKAEILFKLEDHYLLYGQIGIVGLEYSKYFQRFISLFGCDYDKISCALLVIGDYFQIENNGWRYQLGSVNPKSWQNLFHKSALIRGFDNTKNALDELLSRTNNFTNEFLQEIINNYLAECEKKSSFDWKYYYVKYCEFRPFGYGKYSWENFNDEPYCLSALRTEKKRSTNSYQPFLKELESGDNLSREDWGLRLIFGKRYVECKNDSYVVRNLNTDAEERRLKINQQGGVDTEDRIEKFKNWAEGYLY